MAVATAFAQGVADPQMSSIGGNGTLQVLHAASGEHLVIDFYGRAPINATTDMWADKVVRRLPAGYVGAGGAHQPGGPSLGDGARHPDGPPRGCLAVRYPALGGAGPARYRAGGYLDSTPSARACLDDRGA